METQKLLIAITALLAGLSLVLSGCGPASTATQSPVQTPPAAGEPVDRDEAKIPDQAREIVLLVEQDLAEQQNITTAEIHVVEVEAAEWPDTGLGCPKPGRPVLDVITPGYRVVLEAGGEQFAYHTGADNFVLCPESLQADKARSEQPDAAEPKLDSASAPIVDQALKDLSERLGIRAAEITLVVAREVDWPDSSLGCPKPGMNYLMVITPGSMIQLEAQGQVYQYHSGKGQVIYCENPKLPFGTATDAEGQMVKPAQADLAQKLGIPTTEVQVVQVEAVQWPDASLGCPEPGHMYAQMITPGFQIILSAQGKEYDYRATSGTVRLCETPEQ